MLLIYRKTKSSVQEIVKELSKFADIAQKNSGTCSSSCGNTRTRCDSAICYQFGLSDITYYLISRGKD